MVDLTRAVGLTTTNDLAQAGVTENDLTRLLDGGMWSTPANNNQQQNYLTSAQQDTTALQSDLAAMAAHGITVNGQAFTPNATDTAALNTVAAELNVIANNLPNSIGIHGLGAQNNLHNADLTILNVINGDPNLAGALANAAYTATTGATDVPFQQVVHGSSSVAQAATPGATLGQIGGVFNDAITAAIGGINVGNIGQISADMAAVHTGLQNTVNSPQALALIEAGESPQQAALTTIHLDTLVNQAGFQATYTNAFATNPTLSARGTADNLNDMSDIVQNDPALGVASGGNGTPGHIGGFGLQPGGMVGTITPYLDNGAQTNFWSAFLSEANVIQGQLGNVANGLNAAGTAALTATDVQALQTELNNYAAYSSSFAAGQVNNGQTVFAARFQNELQNGTVQADTLNAQQALTDILNHGTVSAADAAKLMAAGVGYAADAADVSGNNLALGGNHYNGNAVTVAAATTPNGLGQQPIPVPGAADPNTGLAFHGTTTTGTPMVDTAQSLSTALSTPAGVGTQVLTNTSGVNALASANAAASNLLGDMATSGASSLTTPQGIAANTATLTAGNNAQALATALAAGDTTGLIAPATQFDNALAQSESLTTPIGVGTSTSANAIGPSSQSSAGALASDLAGLTGMPTITASGPIAAASQSASTPTQQTASVATTDPSHTTTSVTTTHTAAPTAPVVQPVVATAPVDPTHTTAPTDSHIHDMTHAANTAISHVHMWHG